MQFGKNELIAAIATPPGDGGIAVIRVSGNGSVALSEKFFHGGINLSNAKSHTIHYGSFVDLEQNKIDNIVASVFLKPNSYTGEDVVELSCHGGNFLAKKILSILVGSGARLAKPGEFTFRAFINNKMDLAQAEAVADLIRSNSEKARRASLDQLNGRLSAQINLLRKKILDLCSLIELELDFAEEGIELLEKNKTINNIDEISASIKKISDTFTSGKLLRGGVKTVLLGMPNSGKSSLLNVLLKADRAIVSDVPGTTRDTISESVHIGGLLFRLIDTAGLRKDAADLVEKEGIKRTLLEIESADLLLFLLDSTSKNIYEDYKYLTGLVEKTISNKKVVILINKIDLKSSLSIDKNKLAPFHLLQKISCKTEEGVEALSTKLEELFVDNIAFEHEDPIIQSLRHKQALDSAYESCQLAKISILNNLSGDFLAVDLRNALDSLGEIVGTTTTEDILNNIFSQFCIGK